MSLVKRIAITGPESTGKSWLAEKLALQYECLWVPEYARKYLINLGHPYTYEDILKIAHGQMASEEEAMQSADKFLFCDTECLVTKIWCDVKFGKCHYWIIEQIEQQPHDLYLLCDIDLAWEPDPLREHPHKRSYLFDLYLNELQKRNLPIEIISGTGEARLKCAVGAMNKHFHD
jgi:NadR type nicotinamide-nucleotide adenylyltransferase